MQVTDISTVFYLGAGMEGVVLVMLYFYEEKLDVDRLRKKGALKPVY